MISRNRPSVYDRRDVHTRDLVSEMALKGLSKNEIENWLNELEISEDVEAVYQKTGGHPLALELFELYGQSIHVDWLQFIDDEILFKLPENEKRLLTTLANYEHKLALELERFDDLSEEIESIQQRCESLLQAQAIEHEAAIRDAEGRTKRVEKELRQQIERLYEDAKHNEHMFREVNREL